LEDLKEDKISEIVLDLNMGHSGRVDESVLAWFGGIVKTILGRALGMPEDLPIKIRGSQSQVDSFTKALAAEKRYLEAYRDYGLDSAATYKTRHTLDAAVKGFERKTGLKWPFT